MKTRKKKQLKKNTQHFVDKTKTMAAKASDSIKETAMEAKEAVLGDKEEAKSAKTSAKIKQTQASDLKENDLILDIRTHLQHAKMALKHPHWHIEAPDINPKEFIKNYHLDGSKTLYIICSTGKKSMEMARKFIDAGYKNVASVIGGIETAKEHGLKMIEHTSWDIQRQAYLTAGALILIGFLLSGMITKIFLIIPFIVGLCLTIQGLSGIALIDNALEKMPWNTSPLPDSSDDDDDEEEDDDGGDDTDDDEDDDDESEEEDEEDDEDTKPKTTSSAQTKKETKTQK